MDSPKEENILYGIKISSVGPANVTGSDVVHEPTSMDLAMKLHYLRGVYYFSSDAVEGLTITKIKESLFYWLDHFYVTCGRFRRPEDDPLGRPYIKCNDCGVRFLEAQCSKTLHECLDMMKDGSLHRQLVSNQVIGPELAFSPPVLIQFTWFKCGGMSIGLSFAHVLGDVFSVSNFINTWGKILAGHTPNPTTPISIATKSQSLAERSGNPQPMITKEPISVKRVDPVGDHWVIANKYKMGMYSFDISAGQLSQVQSKISGSTNEIDKEFGAFECICAIFWKCIAQIREGSSSPQKVTVWRNGNNNNNNNTSLSNSQIISVVHAASDVVVKEANLKKLATLLLLVDDEAKNNEEQKMIEQAVEKDPKTSDFIMYGANLSFANWEEAALYGLELKGEKPVYVNYGIDGIGDGGVILVLPKKDGPLLTTDKDGRQQQGRIVTAILPENEVMLLKDVLNREWSIV